MFIMILPTNQYLRKQYILWTNSGRFEKLEAFLWMIEFLLLFFSSSPRSHKKTKEKKEEKMKSTNSCTPSTTSDMDTFFWTVQNRSFWTWWSRRFISLIAYIAWSKKFIWWQSSYWNFIILKPHFLYSLTSRYSSQRIFVLKSSNKCF